MTGAALALVLIPVRAPAEHPDRRPYVIAVFLSSSEGSKSTAVEAIQRLAERRIQEINRKGGLDGTPVELVILDDQSQAERTQENGDRARQRRRQLRPA